MTSAPKRRWFRFAFSLRTLFVVVTVLCVWLGYELNWSRERKQFLSQPHVTYDFAEDMNVLGGNNPPRTVKAPWGLWIVGERGVACVYLIFDSDEPRTPTSDEEAEGAAARGLFPESKVQVYANPLRRRSKIGQTVP